MLNKGFKKIIFSFIVKKTNFSDNVFRFIVIVVMKRERSHINFFLLLRHYNITTTTTTTKSPIRE